jgi:membrane protease YdiL (CAAX protease family)
MTELPPELNPQIEPAADQHVPWTVIDTWIGLVIMVLTTAALLVLSYFYRETTLFQTLGLLGSELSLLLPVLIILGFRRAGWSALGLRKFNIGFVGMGCGLLLAAYVIVFANNIILIMLHVPTQGEQIFQLLLKLKAPYWLYFVGIFVAPLVEEIFFRGFLFAGLRQGYGWQKAALISSIVFSISHMDLAALIPTFALGFAFAYLYQQARSIWPGIIMHFLVNSVGICALALLQQVHP